MTDYHFIEVHNKNEDGKRFLINTHRIVTVTELADGTVALWSDTADIVGTMLVTESYDTMVGLLTGFWGST